jgi:hypothetical protein
MAGRSRSKQKRPHSLSFFSLLHCCTAATTALLHFTKEKFDG